MSNFLFKIIVGIFHILEKWYYNNLNSYKTYFMYWKVKYFQITAQVFLAKYILVEQKLLITIIHE